MLGSAVLDVAIGLILVFLLMSLICTAMNEVFEGWLKRAKDLEQGIRELLGDADGSGFAKRLYEHPLVFGLFQGTYDPAATKTNLPSYIPSRTFALALMDLVLPSGPASSTQDGTLSGTAGATPSQPTGVSNGRIAGESLSAVAPTAPAGSLQPLRDAVATLQNAQVRGALRPLIDAAGQDVAQARANIEEWYDSSMDRVAGWYKRRVQRIIFCIGLATAVIMNVSTISIAKTLWSDEALRESLANAAQEYARVHATSTEPEQEESAKTKLAEHVDAFRALGVPIGWTSTASDDEDPRRIDHWDPGIWLERLLGWTITAFAISLGAPFWFDLLNKVSVVRSTVKPHEKSPEEGSEG